MYRQTNAIANLRRTSFLHSNLPWDVTRELKCRVRVNVVYVADVPAECSLDGNDIVLCYANHHIPHAAVDLRS